MRERVGITHPRFGLGSAIPRLVMYMQGMEIRRAFLVLCCAAAAVSGDLMWPSAVAQRFVVLANTQECSRSTT